MSKNLKPRSTLYCPELIVANFSTPPQDNHTAYRHGYLIFNETKSSASAFLAKFEVASIYPCWLAPSAKTLLSLSPVPHGPRPEDVNLAAISTVLAIAAVLSLAVISYLLCVSPPPLSFNDLLATPMTVVRSGLSHEHIDAVMSAAEDADAMCSRPASDDDMCAICLEDGLGARLPCGHAFHAMCIRSWLMRGGETCPLCCCVIRPPPVADPVMPDYGLMQSGGAPGGLQADRGLAVISGLVADRSDGVMDIDGTTSAIRRLPTVRRTFARLPPELIAVGRSRDLQVVDVVDDDDVVQVLASSDGSDNRPTDARGHSGNGEGEDDGASQGEEGREGVDKDSTPDPTKQISSE